MTEFSTVLVANRGEIARRVLRTLRANGIRSVAVYSDADADAPHVREADVAVRIGPAAPQESYLSIENVIAAARETGAQAIHPGYGFLSENVAFARACAEAGIVFIGPTEHALQIMGDKIRSKEHVASHGVPVVPGFSAAGLTDAEITEQATTVGFPLLIKPSAGGGGKGMQIVRAAVELPDALATARRVAAASFGDDTLLLERLIEQPRHIEVQVFADEHGAIVHLGERECTLQRRHQKVIEEAPSPIIDADTRERLGAAACQAAASVQYRGAGTVEFLVAAARPDEFFFIEMNTRLQVEHPVTEMVTGLDLVHLQLLVAQGEPLPIQQADVVLSGHAIEARVYAEAPSRGFLPATGSVLQWQPAPFVRTDAAIETGSEVSSDYDPMIAKVIAYGEDRSTAIEGLRAALDATILLGVESNIGFLAALLDDAAVRAGEMDTGLIDRLPAFTNPAPESALLQAAAHAARAPRHRERTGVWQELAGWRLDGEPQPLIATLLDDDDTTHAVRLDDAVSTQDVPVATDADGAVWVGAGTSTTRLRPLSRREAAERNRALASRAAGAIDPRLTAPMPGNVVALHSGGQVSAGEKVVVIEAMKMEHPVLAPADGTVTISVAIGDHVKRDQLVAQFTPAHDASEG